MSITVVIRWIECVYRHRGIDHYPVDRLGGEKAIAWTSYSYKSSRRNSQASCCNVCGVHWYHA